LEKAMKTTPADPAASDEKETLVLQIKEIEDSIREEEAEMGKMHTSIAQIPTSIAQLDSSIAELNLSISRMIEDKEQSLILQQRIAVAEQRVAGLEAEKRAKEDRAEGSRMRLMGLKNDKRTLELEYRTRFGPRDQLSPLKMMSYEATPILSQVEKVSASSICSDHRDLYNIFALPHSQQAESYIPNRRLRDLLDAHEASLKQDRLPVEMPLLIAILEETILTAGSWEATSQASESKITDPNLAIFFTQIKNLLAVSDSELKISQGPLKIPLYLASQKSRPEHRLEWKDFILMGSEAKGVEKSQYDALVQGFQLGGDGAFKLRTRLSIENCVVPIVLSFSDSFQIFAVYLIPEMIPAIVTLSAPLTYLSPEGRSSIARWMLSLRDFTTQTLELLIMNKDQSPPYGPCVPAQNLFFKPIIGNFCSPQITLSFVLQSYHRLSRLDEIDQNLFLFPIGLLNSPKQFNLEQQGGKDLLDACFRKYFDRKKEQIAKGCPVMVFEALSDEWSNEKPLPQYVESYLEKLNMAIDCMNNAGVAHMDLRSRNVMWKSDGGELSSVSLKIIDFEDSLPFEKEFKVPNYLAHDLRYPFYASTETFVTITEKQNDWFRIALTEWVRDPEPNFDNFISRESDRILERIS
jgi:hypothetical protein